MTRPRIGWIGTGAMGRPMCLNLLKAGYSLTVFDRTSSQCAPLVEAGARAGASASDVAAQADVVFSTIFNDEGLRDVVTGADGVLAAASRPGIHVDMSTVSPEASAAVARAFEREGIQYLRAPVSGTVSLAASAQLGCYVSGPRSAFEAVQPVLACLSARQAYVGEQDEARIVKLMINLMVFMSTAAIGEAMAFGSRAGLDRALMIDAINDSIVGCSHFRTKAQKLKQREYSAAGSIGLVAKDLDLALSVARRHDTALPMSALVRQYLAILQGRGLSHLDVTALADVLPLLGGDIDDAALAGHGAAAPLAGAA